MQRYLLHSSFYLKCYCHDLLYCPCVHKRRSLKNVQRSGTRKLSLWFERYSHRKLSLFILLQPSIFFWQQVLCIKMSTLWLKWRPYTFELFRKPNISFLLSVYFENSSKWKLLNGWSPFRWYVDWLWIIRCYWQSLPSFLWINDPCFQQHKIIIHNFTTEWPVCHIHQRHPECRYLYK